MQIRNSQQNLGFNGYICAKFKTIGQKMPHDIEKTLRNNLSQQRENAAQIVAGNHSESGIVLLLNHPKDSMDLSIKRDLINLGFEAEIVEPNKNPFDVLTKMKREL